MHGGGRWNGSGRWQMMPASHDVWMVAWIYLIYRQIQMFFPPFRHIIATCSLPAILATSSLRSASVSSSSSSSGAACSNTDHDRLRHPYPRPSKPSFPSPIIINSNTQSQTWAAINPNSHQYADVGDIQGCGGVSLRRRRRHC